MGPDDLRFDVEIQDGQLLLAPMNGRAPTNEFTFRDGAYAEPVTSVPATIANLAKYLRAADTNANITVSPSAAEIQIKDLKLHGADVGEVVNAVGVATDEAVYGGGGSYGNGRFECSFRANQANLQQNSERTVEVFNMSGYIHSLHLINPPPEAVVQKKLDEIHELVLETLASLRGQGDVNFRFHPGTELLIVIGKPDAIEVTRKIIDALPGQSQGNQEAPLDNQANQQQK